MLLLQELIQSFMARSLMQDLSTHTDSILVLQKSIRSAVIRKSSKDQVAMCDKDSTAKPLMMSILSPRENEKTVEDDMLFVTQMLVNRCLEAEFNVPHSIVKYLTLDKEGALIKSLKPKSLDDLKNSIDHSLLYGFYKSEGGKEYAIL